MKANAKRDVGSNFFPSKRDRWLGLIIWTPIVPVNYLWAKFPSFCFCT